MSQKTGISWTDTTWNPVTGCTRVSEGCRNCYAEGLAATRLKDSPRYKGLAVMSPSGPHWTNKINLHPELLLQPLSWRKPRRIFVNSMSDLFHKDVPDSFIDQIVATMALTPQHTYQILTKRADRMRSYFSKLPTNINCNRYQAIFDAANVQFGSRHTHWPLPNVWLGVSVESQEFAKERIWPLLQTAAAIRFVSAEPLLGPLDLEVIESLCKDWCVGATIGTYLDWVIVGGESGPHARPFKLEWARNLRDQCRGSGVPFFAKQLGSNPLDCDVPGAADPKEHMRYHTDHRSGADPAEWPDDLRVQEFPR